MILDLDFVAHLNDLLIDHPASITRFISTPLHNASVGGAPNSGHLAGKAVDLVFDNRQDFILAARRAYEIGFPGIEADVTNSHLHLDWMPRVWRVVHKGPGIESPLDSWLTGEV